MSGRETIAPSGVTLNLAFSVSLTYGLAGRPGVLTSEMPGAVAVQV